MRIVMFYHSLISDWNHGNAHFLRGVASDLIARGHDVRIFESCESWSAQNLRAAFGEAPIAEFRRAYPLLKSATYDTRSLDLDEALDGANLVLVHEWNEHALVRRVGEHHVCNRGYHLLFHDTHHRALTAREDMAAYDLRNYDGVLAFGSVLRDLYLRENWTQRAWTWHEAADVRIFRPFEFDRYDGDVVWIGNWGDDERSAELHEFLIEPVRSLGLDARVYGVRYPEHALTALGAAGIDYAGWLPNFEAPCIFARFRFTVHVPRRPYAEYLRGIPTIRVFEALACGVPLICAPWDDAEHLFEPGRDYLIAHDGQEMRAHMMTLLADRQLAGDLSAHGLRTILARHTCTHRVDELLSIYHSLSECTQPEAAMELATG